MVFNSLTDAPRNLKEGIDWLMALRGTDAEKNLASMGAALYDFLVDKPVGFTEVSALENVKTISKEFLERPELREMWPASELLGRFNNPVKTQNIDHLKYPFPINDSDYANIVRARSAVPEKIAKDLGKIVDGCETFLDDIVLPEQYVSAYSPEATWDASCAKDPRACAAIFVGVAPMLYAGLYYLRRTSNPANLKRELSKEGKRPREFLKAVGYKELECHAGMTGSDIRNALRGLSLPILDTIYDFAGFWAFY
ncbi:hypothetical protein, conserved [Babesia ovata]|uniref:Uncharacterized protein n=1 Tax=Babesia ovata TaxID=189622 RepID=A0A2H6K6X4_9APIC|nr:uncharacterized protein BOVATA_002330 [Babesia ovata]GBE58740.1 hypothetical protein, conserved [Babesia ovata]